MNEEIPSWLVQEMLAERSLSQSLCLVASLLVYYQAEAEKLPENPS